MLPPIRHARMRGFEKIDFNKLIKDNSVLFTYNEKNIIQIILIKGITKVIKITETTKPSSPNKDEHKAKKTYVLNLIAPCVMDVKDDPSILVLFCISTNTKVRTNSPPNPAIIKLISFSASKDACESLYTNNEGIRM